jgi:Phosphodiester glycosidase/Purple acid Phosphatase, N-terminal domain
VPHFLERHALQFAANANSFALDTGFASPNYYLPEGTPMVVDGLLVSNGVQVSNPEPGEAAATFVFDAANRVELFPYGLPSGYTNTIRTAVTGLYPLVLGGTNIGRQYLGAPGRLHEVNPRTAYGLSADNRTLFIVAVDGRQTGYSDGALDYETADWLLAAGAWNGVNMDGGGSTTLVMADSKGDPVFLNNSSAAAPNNSFIFRTVGAHFGFYAKPLPGFFNDVIAAPDDVSASVSWTTAQPASCTVAFGIATNFDHSTPAETSPSLHHAGILGDLRPATRYFYQITASNANGDATNSPVYSFTTTNYAVTNLVFEVTNPWRFTAANLDGVPWTSDAYDDSAWKPGGPGLLWIDVRTFPNDNVQPKNTELPANPDTGFPYITYYFRSHFTANQPSTRTGLDVSAFVDDGAVFYLNGRKVYRLRMDPNAGTIRNMDLATGFPCLGDAVCVDHFTVAPTDAPLQDGDNILAVEVHNVDPLSPDITFGMSLQLVTATGGPPILTAAWNAGVEFNWNRGGFILQSAPAPDGPWFDVPGPVIAGPYKVAGTNGAAYYRLYR